jgi:hypothetical protein
MLGSLSENHLRPNLLGLYFSIADRYTTADTAKATTAEAIEAIEAIGAIEAIEAIAAIAATEATKRGDFICNNINRYCLPPLFY